MSIIFNPVKVSRFDIPVRCTDIWFTGDNGTTIVFSYVTYKLERYDLNIVGTFMWHLCDGNHSIEDIANIIGKLAQDGLNEGQEIIDYCIEFIQTLQDYGVIYIDNSHEL